MPKRWNSKDAYTPNGSGDQRPGQPAVILEAGSSDSSVDWSLVQPEVTRCARVCSYDRSGTGWSELGPFPHTDRQIVYELGLLLEAGGERPPYERRLVSLTFASWNQLDGWLRQIDGLRVA